jgi:hypothetical protein
MKEYTAEEIQQIIDDLEFARFFFPTNAEVSGEMRQVAQSLERASEILTELQVEKVA